MATTRLFQDMINDYIPNDIFKEEFPKRDYLLKNVKQDNTWLGGSGSGGQSLIVPFKGNGASSVRLGSLTASNDIASAKYVRGKINNQPEAWGSLIFNERDLMEHGKLSEQNLLKLLPGEIDDLMNHFKNIVSLSWLNGPVLCTLTGNGQADGTCIVDRPERLQIGMKISLQDGNTAAASYYITALDMNTATVTLSATRGGATAADISAYTTAQSAVMYNDGAETAGNRFSNIKDMLLSSANGGSATIYGQTKALYPYLQAINGSGSTIDATNILTKLFEFQTVMRNRAAGMASKVLCSYKHWGSVMALLEQNKGPFRQASDAKASLYGWDEVEIAGPKGHFTLVALQEMNDDFMAVVDLEAFKVYSNGFFKKRVGPDGNEYFTVRNESGYQYIIDMCFFGDLVLERPSRCGIIHSINY